jgi:hypothetical protein
MADAVEDSHGDITVTARCERCGAATPHGLYFECEGDVTVLLSECGGCRAFTVLEGDDAAAAV